MEHQPLPLYVQFYNASMQMHRASKKLPPPCKELSHFEFLCLKMIRDYGQENPELPGIKPSLLSEKTHVSRPAMSQHINALEAKGFIRRATSQTDRRVTYLSLAPRGEELIRARTEHLMRYLQKICDMLGHDDTVALIELTNKVSEIYLMIAEQEQSQTALEKGGIP